MNMYCTYASVTIPIIFNCLLSIYLAINFYFLPFFLHEDQLMAHHTISALGVEVKCKETQTT